MKKRDRHELIKEIVRATRLSTQREIQVGLEARGIEVTQTTLSRDLRELGLIKARDKAESFYILPESQETEAFIQMLASYVQKVERSSFMLVMHTQLGEAGVTSNIIDAAKPHAILGTVAGADTVIAICRDEASAIWVQKQLILNDVLSDLDDLEIEEQAHDN
ncbi:arginine repressor [Streptococcus merionis]|uniref:Arginine repressor n=1 Tax=Streptococcus merionis TaxID=400065 RepID=A0A239SY96_9STRE|nr:arginine repressor [Streptococcus merionis]SNU90222.1 arginine repressor [Streptococcus merionis]